MHLDNPFSPGGEFIATIAGTDQKRIFSTDNKPAAFAICIQDEENGEIIEQDCRPVPVDVSDENEALVLSVRHLLNLCNERSKITLRSSSTYIVDTINKYLASWKANGWLNNQGESPKYPEHWKEIDRLKNEKALFIEAVHVKKAYAAKDTAFQFARELATGERDIHGRKIGAPLAGFDPLE